MTPPFPGQSCVNLRLVTVLDRQRSTELGTVTITARETQSTVSGVVLSSN